LARKPDRDFHALGDALIARLLAIDPGDVHIGLAVSDPGGVIARPLRVVRHQSRRQDVAAILEAAKEQEVERIIIGVPYGLEGEVGPQARRAVRLSQALQTETSIPVVTWDETGSSQAARFGHASDRLEHARAAAVILQEYLDASAR
jgi:putative holliday junction resolvase